MTVDELHRLFLQSGYVCRVQRDEVVLQVCVHCGNEKYNLECAADKGVYYCWACQKGGRLSQLLRDLTGQNVHIPVTKGDRTNRVLASAQVTQEFQSIPISESVSASNYLAARGLASTVAQQYGLVVCTDEQHPLFTRICIPVRDWWHGELFGWVGRSYTLRKPKYLSTVPTKQIAGWRLKDLFTPIVVVEGPLDAIFAHRAGFQSAALQGVGGGGIVEWADRIPTTTPVVLMLDGEAADQQRTLYWKLAALRPVYQVHLDDQQDPANVGIDRLRELVVQALP